MHAARTRTRKLAITSLHTGLLREAELGRVAAHLVDNVLALEEDVAEDVDANVGAVLDAAEACRRAIRDWGVVDVFTRDCLLHTANRDAEVRECGAARENVSALCRVVLSSADFCVVGLENGGVDVDQSCAGVEDTADAGLGGSTGADAVAGCAEAPEALAGVGGDVGDGSSVLGGVNVAEVVGTGSMVFEVNCKERRRELALDSIKEGGLLHWADGVDGAHGKTKETVSVNIGGEAGRDGCGGLDRLGGGSDSANHNFVGIHFSTGTGSITVRDLPCVASLGLGRIGGVVVMARPLRGGLQIRVNPANLVLS
jgi:hypothetical protein